MTMTGDNALLSNYFLGVKKVKKKLTQDDGIHYEEEQTKILNRITLNPFTFTRFINIFLLHTISVENLIRFDKVGIHLIIQTPLIFFSRLKISDIWNKIRRT